MDDKHKQPENPITNAQIEQVINSLFEGAFQTIQTDPNCKSCGGKGIHKTVNTVMGTMTTVTNCPSCKVEHKSAAAGPTAESRIRRLYSFVFKFIAGNKADKKYVRVLSHGVIIYLLLLSLYHLVNLFLLLEGVSIFPHYGFSNFAWGLVNIVLVLIGVKVAVRLIP